MLKEKLQGFNDKLEVARKKRLEERRQERIRERKIIYRKEKEEARKQALEEQERKGNTVCLEMLLLL